MYRDLFVEDSEPYLTYLTEDGSEPGIILCHKYSKIRRSLRSYENRRFRIR